MVANNFRSVRNRNLGIVHFLLRLVVASIILAITAALTPGFVISGIWPLLMGALVLALFDYVALRTIGIDASPFGKGITGFILAVAILYITQFFVEGYSISIWGALLGALVYGIIDAVIPGKFTQGNVLSDS